MDPAVQAGIEHVRQQLAQQLQQQQIKDATALQQQVNAAVVAAGLNQLQPALSRGVEPRMQSPPQYDGRTAGGVDVWLRELRKQFEWYGVSMQTDAQRIRFGGAHLSGIALDWWESIEATRPATWVAFGDVLRARFQPVNSADAARAQLDKLRHGSNQLVHEYTVEFRRLLTALPKMEEGDRVYRYVSGLQPRLSGLVRLQGPTNLADAIAFAARVDGTMMPSESGSGASRAQGSSSSSSSSTGSSSHGGSSGGVMGSAAAGSESAMDLNAVWSIVNTIRENQARDLMELNALRSAMGQGAGGAPPARLPFVTNVQIQERRDKNACFACGKVGHRKIDCPSRR